MLWTPRDVWQCGKELNNYPQLSPYSSDWFSLGLCFVSAVVTINSMKKCLQPIEVAQVIQLLKDGVFIYSKKLCCGRREDVICRKQDMALEGHQPKHRTCVCILVQQGCRHVTLKVTKVVISLLTGIFLIKLWETVFMSLWVKHEITAQHEADWLASPRRHLNRQVHHWFLFVLTVKNHFYLETIGRFFLTFWSFAGISLEQNKNTP